MSRFEQLPVDAAAPSAGRANRIAATARRLRVHGTGGVVIGRTLTLTPRLLEGYRPTIEFLLATVSLKSQERGVTFASLSGAPAYMPDTPLRELAFVGLKTSRE